jgi:carbonic anhydrase
MSDRRNNLLPAVIIAAAAVVGGKLAASSNSAAPAAAAPSVPATSPTVPTSGAVTPLSPESTDTALPAGPDTVTEGESVTPSTEFLGPTPTEVPKPNWDYGDNGPSTWESTAPECGAKTGQSPIRIDTAGESAKQSDSPSFGWALSDTAGRVVNDGAHLYVTADPGSGVRIEGARFDFTGLDIHTPAEHVVDDEGYAAELVGRFVSAEGVELQVSLLVDPGAHNELLDPIVDGAPTEAGFSHPTQGPVELAKLFPVREGAVFYEGSSTTPPCTAGVGHLVLSTVIEASPEQLRRLTDIIDFTARPLQPQAGVTTIVVPPAAN